MSLWPSIALGGAAPKGGTHPLDGQGNPRYSRHQNISGVYRLSDYYLKNNQSHPSSQLFDARNPWLKEGVASRLFPVWSSKALYEQCGTALYRSLLRQYYLQKQGGKQDVSTGAEDLWTDVQLYFIERTELEQRDYPALTEQHGSFSHYPLAPTYKNGDELLLGILSLYHARIRECFRPRGLPLAMSLEEIEKDRGLETPAPSDPLDLNSLSDEFLNEVKALKGIESGDIAILLSLLSFTGPWPSRMKRLGKRYQALEGRLRRWAHHLETRSLHEILRGLTGGAPLTGAGQAKKNRRLILRRLAENLLARQGAVHE